MCLLILPLLHANPSLADDEFERQTLIGLGGVYVLIEDLHEDVRRIGITESRLRTDIELKLRMAGIKVLTNGELLRTPGQPSLYLALTLIHRSNRTGHPYSLALDLQQGIKLDRDPSISVPGGVTWGTNAVGIGDAPFIRQGIKDQVDKFINAYLSVNPKG